MPSLRGLRRLLGDIRAAEELRRSVLARASARHAETGAMPDELGQAIERWKTWFGRRDEVAARVLPGVARWEWSTGRRHSLLPLHFERYPGRGRLLKEPPTPKAQHTRSGLAVDGRLLVRYGYDYLEQAFESFVLHGDAVTETVEFSPGPHIPLEHARIEWEGGRVARHESFRLNGYSPKMGAMGRSPDRLVDFLGPNGRFFLVEDYRYEGPLLREIVVYGETPGLGPHRYVDHVSHDGSGSVTGINRTWQDGSTQAVYRPRRKGQSLGALQRAAVAELVPAVAGVVGAAAAGERVYCVELSYRGVQQYFPPLVTIGFEGRRAALSEPDLVFRPMLSGGRTVELPEPDRMEACRQLDQEVRSGQRWSLGTRMLRDAAAALSRHAWTGILDVTDDFVAFAVDPELDDLVEALAASAPPDRVDAWKARGWL